MDIVDTLRHNAPISREHYMHRAADEIERLREKLRVAEQVLQTINAADKGSEQRRLKCLAKILGGMMVDLFKVMERECLHSEHAAQCFLDAKRKARKSKKENRALTEQSENEPPRCESPNYTAKELDK